MSGCRGEIEQDEELPRVRVWCLGDEIPEWIDDLEHGIEEEGVSWVVQSGYEGGAVPVAHQAAVESKLKIGVGVTHDERIVVHHKQLPSEDPVFDVSDTTPKLARRLGTNSARLAKGIPLKTIS